MKIRDYNHNLLGIIPNDIKPQYSGSFEDSIPTITFTINKEEFYNGFGDMTVTEPYKYLTNENIIEFENDYYIIIDINETRSWDSPTPQMKVTAKHMAYELVRCDIDGVWGFMPGVEDFDDEHIVSATALTMLTEILSYSNGWEVGNLDIPSDIKRTIKTDWVSVAYAISEMKKIFECVPIYRVMWNNGWHKYVDLRYLNTNVSPKITFRYDRDMVEVQRKIDTSLITTRLYVYGSAEHKVSINTIGDIWDKTGTYLIHKEGNSYIENFDYYLNLGYTIEECQENFVFGNKYENDALTIDDVEVLFNEGVEKLSELSQPKVEYTVQLKDLYWVGEKYSEIKLGDAVRVYDKVLGLDFVTVVIALNRNYANPVEETTITLENRITSFSSLFNSMVGALHTISKESLKRDKKYANSVVVNDNRGIVVYDEYGNERVLLGQYELDKYGLKMVINEEKSVVKMNAEDGFVIEKDGVPQFSVDQDGNVTILGSVLINSINNDSTTEIDGGKIKAHSITTVQLDTEAISTEILYKKSSVNLIEGLIDSFEYLKDRSNSYTKVGECQIIGTAIGMYDEFFGIRRFVISNVEDFIEVRFNLDHQLIPVEGNQNYIYSSYFTGVPQVLTMLVAWYDSNRNVISESAQEVVLSTVDFLEYERLWTIVKSPENARYATLGVIAVDDLWIDNQQFEKTNGEIIEDWRDMHPVEDNYEKPIYSDEAPTSEDPNYRWVKASEEEVIEYRWQKQEYVFDWFDVIPEQTQWSLSQPTADIGFRWVQTGAITFNYEWKLQRETTEGFHAPDGICPIGYDTIPLGDGSALCQRKIWEDVTPLQTQWSETQPSAQSGYRWEKTGNEEVVNYKWILQEQKSDWRYVIPSTYTWSVTEPEGDNKIRWLNTGQTRVIGYEYKKQIKIITSSIPPKEWEHAKIPIIDGNIINAGTLRSVDGSTLIDLNDGSFSFGDGDFTYEDDEMKLGIFTVKSDGLVVADYYDEELKRYNLNIKPNSIIIDTSLDTGGGLYLWTNRTKFHNNGMSIQQIEPPKAIDFKHDGINVYNNDLILETTHDLILKSTLGQIKIQGNNNPLEVLRQGTGTQYSSKIIKNNESNIKESDIVGFLENIKIVEFDYLIENKGKGISFIIEDEQAKQTPFIDKLVSQFDKAIYYKEDEIPECLLPYKDKEGQNVLVKDGEYYAYSPLEYDVPMLTSVNTASIQYVYNENKKLKKEINELKEQIEELRNLITQA